MSSRGRDLLKLSSIIVVTFGLGIAFASALDLPRPGRAEQSPRSRPCHRSRLRCRNGRQDHAGKEEESCCKEHRKAHE